MKFFSRRVIFPFVIILSGLCLYVNSWKGPFIWDDEVLVRDNVYLKSPSKFKKLVTEDVGAGSNARYNFYRPLHMATFFINYSLSGLNPAPYRITNTLLHIVTALLFYRFIALLSGSCGAGFLAGLLFIAHPVNVEAVTYISGRADILSALFMLLSFTLYLKLLEKNSRLLFIGILAAYSAAFLSKENAVVFPALLLLYHFSYAKKIKPRIFLPVLAVCVFMVGIRLVVLKQIFFNLFYSGALFKRVPGFFDAVWNYLGIIIFPFQLHMERGNRFFGFTEPGVWLGIAAMALLLAGSFALRKKNQFIFFFVWWFFIALLPSSSIFPVLAFYMAEHWLYLPALGFFALLALGLARVYKKAKPAAIISAAAIFVFYSFSTIQYNRIWADKSMFYEYCLKFSPQSGFLLNNLGVACFEAARYEGAVKFCSMAIKVNPDFSLYRCNLGRAYLKTGEIEKAKYELDRAIMLYPHCEYAHLCMGEYYMRAGKIKDAIGEFKSAVRLNPDYIRGYLKLAEAYAADSDMNESRKANENAFRLNGGKITPLNFI